MFSAFFIAIGAIIVAVTMIPFSGKSQLTTVNETSYAAPAEQMPDLKVGSKAAYLVENSTGKVLFEQNATERRPIASMTKIMTLLLTLEQVDGGTLNLEDKITISQNAASMGGSQAFLDAGSEYRVTDLIKTVVVCSANDSSVALAEHIAGSVDEFVKRMNNRAKELGMENTLFVNCTGLPAPGQYCCAKDVSVMTRELLKHKDYYNYTKIWMEDFVHPTGRTTSITNTNKLIRFYEGCDSGKTGYTAEAGHCLSASARRNGMRLVSVVIGAPDSKTRFADSQTLLNYGFANYETREILSGEKHLEERLNVLGGKCEDISLRPEKGYSRLTRKGEKGAEPEIIVELNEKVKAPLAEGDVVGKIKIVCAGEVLAEINAVAAESVEKAGWLDGIKTIIKNWI